MKTTLEIELIELDGNYTAAFNEPIKGTKSLSFHRVVGGKKEPIESGIEMADRNRMYTTPNPLVFAATLCEVIGSARVGKEEVRIGFSKAELEKFDPYEEGAIKKILDLYAQNQGFSITYA